MFKWVPWRPIRGAKLETEATMTAPRTVAHTPVLHMHDHAPKLWLHRRRIYWLDYVTALVYLSGAVILYWRLA